MVRHARSEIARSNLHPYAQSQRAEVLPRRLRLELLSAPHVGVGEANGAGADGEAGLEIGDVGIAVDGGAVLVGVAVQEEVVRNGAALHAREDRPGKTAA